jgi:Zn-finger protein
MHELANEIIGKRIEDILGDHDFKKRKKSNPESCICYQQDKKCHNIEELNCFFCYCPEYNRSVEGGSCKRESPNAKYINNKDGGKILDCSGCDFPHKKENAIKLLDNLFR